MWVCAPGPPGWPGLSDCSTLTYNHEQHNITLSDNLSVTSDIDQLDGNNTMSDSTLLSDNNSEHDNIEVLTKKGNQTQ